MAVEILAPAGGREQFLAAIGAGADAVYLGLKAFNARARAANFTIEELSSLMPIARKAKVRVLVTLNVLIKQEEIPALLDVLCELQWLGVFAVIVQDAGTARLIRNHFPALRLHASTQMAIHNVEGVQMAREMGFRRVVLARELTLREISRIREALPRDEMEIETFCHGSLCYSYSGLCLFSGAEDARSGNRGECAYTCRRPYRLINEPGFGFLFSMKDLDASHMVQELVEAGVDALKIEGRKKDAQFVASAVGLYRSELTRVSGKVALAKQKEAFQEDLDYSYQRDTTSFFLEGRYYENVIDLNNPTHKGALVGVVRDVRGRQIHLRTTVALELYDGIRVDRPEQRFHAQPQHGERVDASFDAARSYYRNEICEFSLRELYGEEGRMQSAAPNTEITIQIPPGESLPHKGDLVFKVRSNELKRRVESIVQEAARLDRERPMRVAVLHIDVSEKHGKVSIEAQASLAGAVFASVERLFVAERPRTASRLREDLLSIFRIVGDAGFEMEVTVNGDSNWFVPAAELKALRRDLAAALTAGTANLSAKNRETALVEIQRKKSPAHQAGKSRFQVKLDRLETLEALAAFCKSDPAFALNEVVFEPKRMFLGRLTGASALEEIRKRMPEQTVLRIAVPVVVRSWDRPGLADLLRAAADADCLFEAANPGAIRMLRQYGKPIAGDFTLYALNSLAAKELHELGLSRLALSVEDDRMNLEKHLPQWPEDLDPQAIVFKDTPLFIAEACSLTALHNGCPTSKVCGYRTLEIENEDGERFFVAHEQCKSIVYGKKPYSITQRIPALEQLGVRNMRADFLTRPYSPDQITEVLRRMAAHTSVPETHEANYSRSLL